MDKITIRKPDDWHIHLRQGKMLRNVLPYTSRVFARALVMGNLLDPVVTVEDVIRYRDEILNVSGNNFIPAMSIMLVKKTTPEIVEQAFRVGVKVLKLIPGNTSTNSDEGVASEELEKYYPVLEKARELGVIFSAHWERVSDDNGQTIMEIEREKEALPFFRKIIEEFPDLKIIAEHANTQEMIELVKVAGPNVAATLTYHHAAFTTDDVINEAGEIINAFNYCKPIAKTETDRKAVVAAMTSGNPKFFFGSDSAPHPLEKKLSANPPAGIFNAPVVLPGLAEIFEREGQINKLEDFVSRFGAQFYGLPLNEGNITLIKEDWQAPEMIGNVKVFRGGKIFSWKVKED